jgi:putative phosphoribosyl transferase
MHTELIRIKSDSVQVEGVLELPAEPCGLILFAHGSGSGRTSPRNNYVAAELRHAHLGTLLMDLLTAHEDENYATRFDISLLARRLGTAIDWLKQAARTRALPLGLFGASTGAAAALRIATLRGADVGAVVSRGGRPDLAGQEVLAKVCAPTLLLVGGSDRSVIELNRLAYSAMHCEKRIELIPGATHLFEEPGALEAVAELAAAWFVRYLASPTPERMRNIF